jgi:hypothetical protein
MEQKLVQIKLPPQAAQEHEPRPDYVPPQVVTYRGQDVLQELGPAQACSFNHSVLICP